MWLDGEKTWATAVDSGCARSGGLAGDFVRGNDDEERADARHPAAGGRAHLSQLPEHCLRKLDFGAVVHHSDHQPGFSTEPSCEVRTDRTVDHHCCPSTQEPAGIREIGGHFIRKQCNLTPETAYRSGRMGLLPPAYLSSSQSAGSQEGEAVLTTWCTDALLEFHALGRRSVAGLFHIRQGAMPRRSRLRGSGGKCAGRHTSSPSLVGQWRRLHAKPVPHHLRGARPREGGERKSERCGRCSGIFCNISRNWGRHGGDATSRRRWHSNHRDNVRDP